MENKAEYNPKRGDTTMTTALVKKEVVDVVAQKVRQFQAGGELRLPADYSPENAMKSAWLALQEITNKDGKLVLQYCTRESIANTLLDMVVQGLNPAKKQCYFVAYGDKLTLQRSYFGTMALAKRVDEGIGDIFAEVVYENDIFKYRIEHGKKYITEHEQAIENVSNKKIVAAYCQIIGHAGEVRRTEIMPIDEIKQAWRQSRQNPIDEKGAVKAGTVHDKFTAEMCKRTVINRACKPIINSSSDRYLLLSLAHADEIAVAAEIAEHANTILIDTVDAEVVEALPPPTEKVVKKREQEPEREVLPVPDF